MTYASVSSSRRSSSSGGNSVPSSYLAGKKKKKQRETHYFQTQGSNGVDVTVYVSPQRRPPLVLVHSRVV